MGLIKNIVFIVLILIAFNHFFPNQYESSKQWTVDKVQSMVGGYTSDKINSLQDQYGKTPQDVVNGFTCSNDKECISYLNNENAICSNSGICIGG